jgi:hypothetical protein
MTLKPVYSQSVDPVLQELWQVKDAINERFGNVSEYVAYLRSKAVSAQKILLTARAKAQLAKSKTKLKQKA